MKKFFYLVSLALVLGALSVSCSKEKQVKQETIATESIAQVDSADIVEELPKSIMRYTGKLGPKMSVHLIVSDNREKGAYSIDKGEKDQFGRLKIVKFEEEGDSTFQFDEYNAKGDKIAVLEGKITPEGLEGTYSVGEKSGSPFKLTYYEGDDIFPDTEWEFVGETEEISTMPKDLKLKDGKAIKVKAADLDAWIMEYAKLVDECNKLVESGASMTKLDDIMEKMIEKQRLIEAAKESMTPEQKKRYAQVVSIALN